MEYPVRTIRVPCVVNPVINQESQGGYLDASFTIPVEYARQWGVTDFQRYSQVWLFDGLSPAYYGFVDLASPSVNGDIVITANGHYALLARTRMRIIWDDSDTSKWVTSKGSSKNGQVATESDGDLTLSFQMGTTVAAGDYVAVDYFAFGEAIGSRDGKKIDGFDVSAATGNYDGNPNLVFRVYGMSSPSDTSPTLLYATTASPSWVHEENATNGAWASSTGYRCIRMGLYATGAVTFSSAERRIRIDRIRVSTRARSIGVDNASHPYTSTLVADMFEDGSNTRDLHYMLSEPSNNALAIGDQVTGNIAASGFHTTGMNFTDWTKPSEILDTLASIDGNVCGMWSPARRIPDGSYDVDTAHTTAQYWYWAPPELVYTEWSSPDDPDYYAYLARGAVWEPDGNADDMVTAEYVNYPNRRGNQVSAYYETADLANYLWSQGIHVADDYTSDPAVGAETATSLAQQYVALRNKPTLSGRLTIYADRPGAAELPGGARLLKLSTVRAGTTWRIPDAKAFRFGRCTRLEYTPKTQTSAESITLTMNTPAAMRYQRRLSNLTRKADRQRLR